MNPRIVPKLSYTYFDREGSLHIEFSILDNDQHQTRFGDSFHIEFSMLDNDQHQTRFEDSFRDLESIVKRNKSLDIFLEIMPDSRNVFGTAMPINLVKHISEMFAGRTLREFTLTCTYPISEAFGQALDFRAQTVSISSSGYSKHLAELPMLKYEGFETLELKMEFLVISQMIKDVPINATRLHLSTYFHLQGHQYAEAYKEFAFWLMKLLHNPPSALKELRLGFPRTLRDSACIALNTYIDEWKSKHEIYPQRQLDLLMIVPCNVVRVTDIPSRVYDKNAFPILVQQKLSPLVKHVACTEGLDITNFYIAAFVPNYSAADTDWDAHILLTEALLERDCQEVLRLRNVFLFWNQVLETLKADNAKKCTPPEPFGGVSIKHRLAVGDSDRAQRSFWKPDVSCVVRAYVSLLEGIGEELWSYKDIQKSLHKRMHPRFRNSFLEVVLSRQGLPVHDIGSLIAEFLTLDPGVEVTTFSENFVVDGGPEMRYVPEVFPDPLDPSINHLDQDHMGPLIDYFKSHLPRYSDDFYYVWK